MLREIEPDSAPFAQFIEALEAAALPTNDLISEPFRYFTSDELAWGGVGAGKDALLRSLVVLPNARGHGLGVVVTQGLIEHAKQAGAERIWLLTTSAADFFAKLGFRIVDRAEAPPAIAQSRQFAGLCPNSATLMSLPL